MGSIMDKLYKRVEERGVVCVGLDTALDYIPSFIKEGKSEEDAIVEFNKGIIDATEDVAACFKVQIAYYEALGIKGLSGHQAVNQKYIAGQNTGHCKGRHNPSGRNVHAGKAFEK